MWVIKLGWSRALPPAYLVSVVSFTPLINPSKPICLLDCLFYRKYCLLTCVRWSSKETWLLQNTILERLCKTAQWIADAALLHWMCALIIAPLVKVPERNRQRFCHLIPGAQHFGAVSEYTPWVLWFLKCTVGEVGLCSPQAASGPCSVRHWLKCSICAAPGEPRGSNLVPGHRCQQEQAPACWGPLSSFFLNALFWAAHAGSL